MKSPRRGAGEVTPWLPASQVNGMFLAALAHHAAANRVLFGSASYSAGRYTGFIQRCVRHLCVCACTACMLVVVLLLFYSFVKWFLS